MLMLRRGRCFALSYWASTPIGTSISATVPRFFFLYKLTVGRVKLKLLKMKKVMFTAFAVGLCLSANVMAQVPSYVPSNGLVGYWPFNSNANDESGNGNNGTVNGATLTTDRFGNSGNSYDYNGINSFIRIPSSDNLKLSNSFTLSFWINPILNLGIESYSLIVKGNNNSNEYSAILDNNMLSKLAKQNLEYVISSNQIIQHQDWTNITYTFSNSSAQIFINGVLNQVANSLTNFNTGVNGQNSA
jgi:hypothetical protein